MPPMQHPLVLSRYQAVPLLAAHRAGQATATTSPDLGLSSVETQLTEHGVVFPSGETVAWADLERIAAAENQCFVVEDGMIRSIQVFSETTSWLRSLMPTAGAPTMLVAGFPMHRIKNTDPWKDSEAKVAAATPISGGVLDTATGLGYTAILAARTADSVVTVELDPAGLEVARYNPWSRELFENPKIRQIVGDVFEEIQRFPDGAFSRVLHDPPTLSLAGELYSGAFYQQVHRVLRSGGRMFHYIGDPASALGKRTTTGVIRRLVEAGFRRVERRPEAFGVVACK
jgi:predicted methyltransferase